MATDSSASPVRSLDVPVLGMDCAACVRTTRDAIASVPGVESVEVFLAGERANVRFDSTRTGVQEIRAAVERAGYRSPEVIDAALPLQPEGKPVDVSRKAMTLMAAVFAVVLVAVIVGELLGLFEVVTRAVPLWLGALLVLTLGFPVFRNVVLNAVRGRIISHTLMSAGALAALAVGEWTTAALVVVFMRIGDYAESFTVERARSSLRELSALLPRTARVERDGEVNEVPSSQVRAGEIVVVRPGEAIPVDGEVVSGTANVDQSSLTGESMPIGASSGSEVKASALVTLGAIRVEARRVGSDTTFGQVLKQVEEAEANRGRVERFADRFSAWYLPLVASIALATYLLSGDVLAAVAVSVVACSCAFALATPVAMLATIGAAARRGLLIKGGKYIESLARATVLVVDKTGTITRGRPSVTDIVPHLGFPEEELLRVAACAELDSEHPLAEAVLEAARRRGLAARRPEEFEALPGRGVRAVVDGTVVEVGSIELVAGPLPAEVQSLAQQGKSILVVLVDGSPAGFLAAADELRPEVAAVIARLREGGFGRIEMLTGDHEAAARSLGESLGIGWRAELLPHDKVEAIRRLQAEGEIVVMIGDGVNDAPALAQADVGVAMGVSGTEVARQTAHVTLLEDDWNRVPELFDLAGRTMRVVRTNIGFTAAYNLVGIGLAAFGILTPILAAAMQSLPDLGIMGNSTRLLRYRGEHMQLVGKRS